MIYKATIDVRLKPGYSDPEGETTAKALQGLGYSVIDVRVGKRYEINFDAVNREEAEAIVKQMCRRQLSNPTRDDYSFEIKKVI